MRPIVTKEGDKAQLWLPRPEVRHDGMATVDLTRDDVRQLHADLAGVLAAFDLDDALAKAVSE